MGGSRNSPATYLVGRSAEADIVLGDPTVSRLHAELVRGGDGKWYLTDRCSTGGTYLFDAAGWVPIAQEFVRPGDRLRLGSFVCTLDDLLRLIPTGGGAGPHPGGDGTGGGATIRDDRPDGPVRRDPNYGHIVPTEDE